MDKNKLKKIIAREGLIIILFVIFILYIKNSSFEFASDYLHKKYTGDIFLKEVLELANKINWVAYLLYPLYLLIRFIIWAIRTSREK